MLDSSTRHMSCITRRRRSCLIGKTRQQHRRRSDSGSRCEQPLVTGSSLHHASCAKACMMAPTENEQTGQDKSAVQPTSACILDNSSVCWI
jgi:hypothetical protein